MTAAGHDALAPPPLLMIFWEAAHVERRGIPSYAATSLLIRGLCCLVVVGGAAWLIYLLLRSTVLRRRQPAAPRTGTRISRSRHTHRSMPVRRSPRLPRPPGRPAARPEFRTVRHRYTAAG